MPLVFSGYPAFLSFPSIDPLFFLSQQSAVEGASGQTPCRARQGGVFFSISPPYVQDFFVNSFFFDLLYHE